MTVSIYQMKKINELRKKAVLLYKQGLTTREVGKVVCRSHQWVSDAIKKSRKLN